MHVIAGRAPEILSELPTANKIFIGGNDGTLNELLNYCWDLLPEGGCLVASSVTQKTLEILSAFAIASFGSKGNKDYFETLQIAVSKGEFDSGQIEYNPSLPVTVFKFNKPVIEQELSDE